MSIDVVNRAATGVLPSPIVQSRGGWSARVASDLTALLDVALVMTSGAVAMQLLAPLPLEPAATAVILILTALAMLVVLRQLGDYDGTDMRALPCRPLRLAAGHLLGFSIVFSLITTTGFDVEIGRAWLPAWLLLSLASIGASRLVLRRYLSARAAEGLFDTNLAIYGAGRVARKLAEHIAAGGAGARLIGIYDERQDPARTDLSDITLAGGLADLIEAGRDGRIDHIVIALPQSADQRIAQIARKLEQLPVRISVCTHISSDLIDTDPKRLKVSAIGPVGLLDAKRKPLADWGPLLKRFEDYAIASFALVLLSPVLLAAAIAIKLDSKGPILFRQKRHGLNHRVIEVLKFRTMHVMEDGASVTQATRNDRRITRVGRFLRRTSIDELPQLINVLRGEMSLVGPRPHAIVHNEYYGEMLERYANRHQVKPGLTGWAQINGYRGETNAPELMQKRVEHDLHYIDNWSLWFDLRIIALTPIYGLRNAY
jgi:Undecaprenyl-phosphate glucose phosphotransferase